MTTTDTAPLSAEELSKWLRTARVFVDSDDINLADLGTEAADALDALSARVVELEHQLDLSEKQRSELLHSINFRKACNRDANAAEARATQAEAERDALREAARPIAAAYQAIQDTWMGKVADDVMLTWGDITAGQMRALVAALSPAQPAQDRRILAPWNPCLEKLKPGEPFFVLLGRDKHAAAAVRCWADQREAERVLSEKTAEARQLADRMDAYRSDGAAPQPAPETTNTEG